MRHLQMLEAYKNKNPQTMLNFTRTFVSETNFRPVFLLKFFFILILATILLLTILENIEVQGNIRANWVNPSIPSGSKR